MISFGEKLRRQREKLGYSLVTFSNILDISQRTLQRLEKNETEPALSIILKLRNIVSKNDYISFFYDDEEIEYIIQNKNEFILTMFEFRNLANKLANSK